MIVSDWLPATPPMLGTTGISTASKHDLVDRGLEQVDDSRREECRAEIDPEPERPSCRAFDDRRKHVVLFVEAGGAHQRVFGFVTNNVDDVVDRDAAENTEVIVDNRRRQQVTILELPDNLR